MLKKILYELYKRKKTNISYFKIFGCGRYILINAKDKLDKFDAKSDEDIFLDYSLFSKAMEYLIKEL